MHQSVKRIIAFSAILFINFNAMFYFYRKGQIATVGSSPHKKTSQTVANHVIRALNEAPKDDAISGGVGLNATSAVEEKPVSIPNAETQKNMGFMGSEEYRTLLETLPSDSRTMQTFLGLVLDESNKSRSGMDAFRSILSMADTSEARNKYAQYKLIQPKPPQDAVTSKKPGAQNPVGMKKQPPAQANTPNKVRNRDSKVKVKLDENGRIQVQEPPKYEVEQLIFEPMRTKYSASLFNMYHAFQPEYFTELTPTIPHIIHQTWDSYDIPGVFKPWIQSIVNKHPDWEYWFWTPKDVECLLRKRYPPKYLETYRKYNAMIFKSDFLRYFLLYEFGGFYIDLDVEALQPLDFWTYKHQCVMSHENYEHTYLLHNRKQPNVMTTIIGSRPQHPYFRLLQENLAQYQRKFARDVLKATGPFYLNEIYLKYIQSTNYTQESVANEITVIHPKYWLPKYDFRLTNKLRQSCRLLQAKLPEHGKELCQELSRRNFANKLNPDAFLDHHWTHVNTWKGNQKKQDLFNLFTVVPQAKRASEILQCS